jgi:protein-tyrosine phosphatase
MVDIHCHILPDLDDGATDLEISLEMCRMAAEDGIEAIVCSAHANDRYPFDPDRVQQKIDEVSAQSGGKPRLYPGCDFHLSYENIQSALADPRRYTINHGSYLLVEFADFAIPPNMDEIFFQFRSRGMIPIITHPERNPWLVARRQQLFEWVQNGALIQVTAASLVGRFGPMPADFSQWLLECRMIHFVATDAHNVARRPPQLRPAYEKVAQQCGPLMANLLFKEHPRAALLSESISPEPPVLPKPKTFFDRITGAFRR